MREIFINIQPIDQIFGTGNAFYPGIRKSLPIFAIDRAVKKAGLQVTLFK